MTPSVDTLINQLLPVRAVSGGNLVAAAKAGIIDALIVANSPLHRTASSGSQLVTISVDGQQYQLNSKQALPVGARLQLQLADNNSVILLKLIAPDSKLPGQTAATVKAGTVIGQLATVNTPAGTAPPSQAPTTEVAKQPTGQQSIEQAFRQALPQQQALKTLLPLLQQLQLTQNQATVPKELGQQINQLLQQFPSAQKLQQPAGLQQAIRNSGIFLEAKLARSTATQSQPSTGTAIPAPAKKPELANDLKALLQQLIPKIEKATGSSLSPAPPASATTSTNGERAPAAIAGYGIGIGPSVTTGSGQPVVAASQAPEQAVDVLLRQLGQQLLATLARTQLNQLESLAIRQQHSTDTQAPVNSWNLELPIVHGQHIDNLELRIEQYLQQQKGKRGQQQKLWTVMLNFDLHRLGKMNVQLKVADRSVSARVWSQSEAAHREVKQHIQFLTGSLEKIGVTVTRVDCQLGLPAKTDLPIYRQLVDIRT